MGLFRGAVFRHGGGARKQPIKQPIEMPTSTMALMGCFTSLMGRFPTLMGRLTDFAPRGRFYLLKIHWKAALLKERGIRRFLNEYQDTFDHDKRQKSAMSGRRLHRVFKYFLQWIFFPFLQAHPPKCGEKLPDFRAKKKAQNPVTSVVAVMVFFGPDEKHPQGTFLKGSGTQSEPCQKNGNTSTKRFTFLGNPYPLH